MTGSPQPANSRDPNSLGYFIISIGFDLTGDERHRKKYRYLIRTLTKGNAINKLRPADTGNIAKLEVAKENNLDALDDWALQGDKRSMIQEYSMDNPKNDTDDDILPRLFVRKKHLLTDKGREGFFHIRLGRFESSAYLYKDHQLVRIFPVRLSFYLNCQFDSYLGNKNVFRLTRNPKVWREAVITLLVESMDRDTQTTLDLLESSSKLLLRIDDISAGLELTEKENGEFRNALQR